MRVVLDTSVLVAAVRSRRGASNTILVHAFQGCFNWLVSVPLFLEYEQALTRAELLLATDIRTAEMSRQRAIGFLRAVPDAPPIPDDERLD